MFKKNVEDYAGGLDKVMALRPKSYETRAEEFKNDLVLPKGRQVGLVALGRNTRSEDISLRDFPNGVYLVRVSAGKHRAQRQIIKW